MPGISEETKGGKAIEKRKNSGRKGKEKVHHAIEKRREDVGRNRRHSGM